MCNGKVCLYILPATETATTDDKIRKIISCHLHTGSGADSIPVSRSKLGKPYLPCHPDLHISVSHSGSWFVCAVSSQPVGVDLQEHTPLRDETPENAARRYCKIAGRFFHPLEASFVLENPQEHFFSVWTAKESYVKFTGSGMDDTYSDFCVVNENLRSQIRKQEPITWQADNVSFHMSGFEDNYTLCVCAENPCAWEWHFPEE